MEAFRMQEHDIINMTYKFAEEYHASDNSGHDFEHIKRVYANVNKLLESEKNANNFIAKMSALLHDVDDHKLNTDGKNTERFLRKIGLENKIIDQILETIGAISFSQSGCNPNFKTLEMKLLSDADKLDAMGAIGICRAICFGNSRQQPLFNSKEFPCAENNKKHVINHFFEKLLQLKKAMQTEVGKKEEQDFISRNSLKYIKLGFQDRSLIGAPFSFFHTIKENAELERVLIDNLMNLRTFDNQHVYCPLGIGKHYNHLETFDVIYKNYSHLAKFFKIIFYADIPYIYYKNNYQNRMKYLHEFFQQYGLTAKIIKLNKEEVVQKVNNLKLYKSQFAYLNDNFIQEKIGGVQKDFKEIIFS